MKNKRYEDEWDNYEPSGHVIVDGDYVPVEDVEVLDIEEDMQGRDLLTFNFAGDRHQSYIVMK